MSEGSKVGTPSGRSVFSDMMAGKGLDPAVAERLELADESRSAMAVASLVLGILGIVLVPILAALIAIPLGLAAFTDARRKGASTDAGLGVAGFVCGLVGLALWSAIIAAVAVTG